MASTIRNAVQMIPRMIPVIFIVILFTQAAMAVTNARSRERTPGIARKRKKVYNSPENVISEISGSEPGEFIDEYVIIEVGSGDGSDTVSVKLEQAGLVEDAQMYDDFLCGNGYDRVLRTGVHEIPRTADWDTIAEILAGRM